MARSTCDRPRWLDASIRGLAALLLAVCASHASAQTGGNWFGGVWDSGLYAWSDPIHPRTIGVRFEVIDSRTRQPVSGATVRLKGTYSEERIGTMAEEALGLEQRDPSTPARQSREFELTAKTGRDGDAVFALSWQKEYPWSRERPLVRNPNTVGEGLSYARSWMRPVDDVEKVQSLEVRHDSYRGVDLTFDFAKLLEVGQDSERESQSPEVFDRFENAWRGEIGRTGIRFCALRLGEQFQGFGETASTRPRFFELVRQKDFGIVYDEPMNLTSLSPTEYSGPYLVYLVELQLEPARQEIVVVPPGSDRDDEMRREDERRAEQQRLDRERSARRAAEERQAQEKARREAEQKRKEEEARKAESARRERAERERKLRDAAKGNALGVAVETLDSARREALGLYLGTYGVVIQYVEPGSLAAKSGLRKDDVIEALGGSIHDRATFLERAAKLKKEDQPRIGIWRRNSKGIWERESLRLRYE